MTPSVNDTLNWNLVCHLNYGEHGALTIIRQDGDQFTAKRIATEPASGQEPERRPVFLGLDEKDNVVLLDPSSKRLHYQAKLPVDAIPAYAYRDPKKNTLWFMNDGDKQTGNDTLNCGDTGSSVTLISHSSSTEFIKTLCVGRGHHVTTFVDPSGDRAKSSRLAFVSNLVDGTITVIDNDSQNQDTYLKEIDLINLSEPDKEKDKHKNIPNNAFPHGKVYSLVTKKLYSLNNGYGTIAVIDPVSCKIERRISLPVSSNLLLSPNGRFIIGKGADRKTDTKHVIGRLSVVDLESEDIVETLDFKDIYPSTYRFSPCGNKLYVTTAATGKSEQRDNLKKNSLLVFDAAALPTLTLLKEITIGEADCGRRPIAYTTRYLFLPNPTDGTLSILDAKDESVLDTLTIGEPESKEVLFSFFSGTVDGC